MRKKYNKRKVGIIFILVALGLFLIGVLMLSVVSSRIYSGISPDNNEIPGQAWDDSNLQQVRGDNIQHANNEIPGQAQDDRDIATLTFADQTVEFSISNNTTLYDAMKSLMAEDKINFTGKEYPSLGFFVTSIGSLESGDGKNLMYYINGKEASLGVSSYMVKEGDSIEWKLK